MITIMKTKESKLTETDLPQSSIEIHHIHESKTSMIFAQNKSPNMIPRLKNTWFLLFHIKHNDC